MPELRKERTIGAIASLLGVSRATLHRVMGRRYCDHCRDDDQAGKCCGLVCNASYYTFIAMRRLRKELERIPTIL
jgi:hypothetical protein